MTTFIGSTCTRCRAVITPNTWQAKAAHAHSCDYEWNLRASELRAQIRRINQRRNLT